MTNYLGQEDATVLAEVLAEHSRRFRAAVGIATPPPPAKPNAEAPSAAHREEVLADARRVRAECRAQRRAEAKAAKGQGFTPEEEALYRAAWPGSH